MVIKNFPAYLELKLDEALDACRKNDWDALRETCRALEADHGEEVFNFFGEEIASAIRKAIITLPPEGRLAFCSAYRSTVLGQLARGGAFSV